MVPYLIIDDGASGADNDNPACFKILDKESGSLWRDSPLELNIEIIQDGKVAKAHDYCCKFIKRTGSKMCPAYACRLYPNYDLPGFEELYISYSLKSYSGEGDIEEKIEIVNNTSKAIQIKSFTLQWKLKSHFNKTEYLPIPFASHNTKPGLTLLDNDMEFQSFYEGLLLKQGNDGLVIAREPSDREPILLGVRCCRDGSIIYGGIARGVPEDLDCICVYPNKTLDFGVAWYASFKGTAENGLLKYRLYMKNHGVGRPAAYSPPINYCAFYEQGEHYQKRDLYHALDYAEELGCTLLYTDQGWETYFGSGIWDEPRLGKLEDFILAARSKGMDVGVLVAMHTIADCMPEDSIIRDAEGNVLPGDPWHSVGICPVSHKWQRIAVSRLNRIAKAGVKFFSFDFYQYTPCFSKSHSHSSPSRRWEHACGLAKIQASIKKKNPGLLMEAHDWMNPGGYHYPMYLFGSGHHERWGFEYMWDPYNDFVLGRLHNLYYCNMAYEKPLYLHIDLQKDNDNCVVFWYIASTVRHLGVGNYHGLHDDKKKIYQKCISIYRKYAEYFSDGFFSGSGPMIHVHTLEDKGSILLLFNDKDNMVQYRFKIGHDALKSDDTGIVIENLYGPIVALNQNAAGPEINANLEPYSVSVCYMNFILTESSCCASTDDNNSAIHTKYLLS